MFETGNKHDRMSFMLHAVVKRELIKDPDRAIGIAQRVTAMGGITEFGNNRTLSLVSKFFDWKVGQTRHNPPNV